MLLSTGLFFNDDVDFAPGFVTDRPLPLLNVEDNLPTEGEQVLATIEVTEGQVRLHCSLRNRALSNKSENISGF